VNLPREELVLILRRRRLRLMMLCVGTAVVCGTAAALIVPRVLVGGERVGGAAAAGLPTAAALAGDGPLGLSADLELDPRELRANVQRWARLSQADQERYFRRYWRLAQLDPDARDDLLEEYRFFREEPKARQEFLRGRAKELQDFVATLGPQDQAVLKGMAPEHRARRLLELWKARYGTW
jgi:hypothetical protein